MTEPMRNRAKRATSSDMPWLRWKGSRIGRYIRFVESYLVIPKGHGMGKPMKLHGYQRESFEVFLDADVRVALEKIAKGNAKTTTMGAFVLAHAFMEEAADVPIVATTVGQAMKTTYGAALAFRDLSPALRDVSVLFTARGSEHISVPSLRSNVYPIADIPAALQGLDPSVAVLDEVGFASEATWSSLTLAAGKRPESKAIGIGTPSFISGNALQASERAWRSGQTIPGFVFIEHAAPEGCDHRDERVWPMANPGLTTRPPILAIDAIRTSLALETEEAFRCFRLAQWPTAAAGAWLGDGGAAQWDECTRPMEFSPNAPTWAGVDVSQRGDCSAVVVGQLRDDGRLHAKARIWYPPDGGTIDPSEIMEELRRLDRDFDLRSVYYDPRYFDLPARMLEDEGLPMMEFPQSLERMTPAVHGCHEAVMRGQITHDADDVFRRHILSAVPRYTEQGGFTLSKTKSTGGKIDAAVALCMMHRAASMPAKKRPSPMFAFD